MEQLYDKIDNDILESGHQTAESDLMENARSNFVRKVYTILSLQLLITAGFVSLSTFNTEFIQYQQNHMMLFWVSLVVVLASSVALGCVKGIATQSPLNLLLLLAFTLAQSYIVSMTCALYTPESVLTSAIGTLGATLFLTAYAIYSKSDFNQIGSNIQGFFWSMFGVTFCLTILNVFFIRTEFLTILISIGIAAIYSVYLLIDTQLILGGKNKELTLDNYILGAILLYIDIIQLFMHILRIIGKLKK